MSARALSMPLEGGNNLNMGSPSRISRSNDPGVLENGVVEEISHLRPLGSSGPTPLNSMALVRKHFKPPKQLTSPNRYHLDFKPGYEHGLFAILVKTAETFIHHPLDLSIKPNGKVRGIDPPLSRNSTAEDFDWARSVINLVPEYKQSELIPELSAEVSLPHLKDIVVTLNAYRHVLLCNTKVEPIENSKYPTDNLNQDYSSLVKERASRRSNRKFKWRDLTTQIQHQYNQNVLRIGLHRIINIEDSKATSRIISTKFPLLASLEATICDFGDSKYERFQTTLASVSKCEF